MTGAPDDQDRQSRTGGARRRDHENIRIGTYGGDCLRLFPPGPGNSTFSFGAHCRTEAGESWATARSAAAVEGGYQLTKLATSALAARRLVSVERR